MTPESREEVTSKVLESLKGTPYEASSLDILSGGTANFIYRATLAHPLADGTKDVAVKHSEDYIASSPDFKLTLSRCRIEEECLKALSAFSVVGKADEDKSYNFIVRTPKFYHFDEGNNTQIQELLGDGIDLKMHTLEILDGSDPEEMENRSLQLGKALGRWLKGFHSWAAQQHELRVTVAANKELQGLKHMINFSWLLDRAKQFTSVLGGAEDVFKEVGKMAAAELEDDSQLQVIHGDFWTGNILLPKAPIQKGVDVPIFVIDWEMSQIGKPSLDVGQMIAELYELKIYKGKAAGLFMTQGFIEGYGPVSEDFAFRTAIQVGAHLISFGMSVQGWGSVEQVEECGRFGRDIITHAWEKDRRWFEESDLACLFSTTE
ncbi:kinase-like domain-containing protein [Daldinia caldariorum]|uniref:kinase-like domain-containing protein n=1 Tax=Daldinia caldariorum TaxID=326644 RepID=UPI002007E67F|nr:kinase-like domain-containing protein [Daldinia caldariorum]KAI1465003.1 kinase-like domain-containing protein [Daldinia caldariorum]